MASGKNQAKEQTEATPSRAAKQLVADYRYLLSTPAIGTDALELLKLLVEDAKTDRASRLW